MADDGWRQTQRHVRLRSRHSKNKCKLLGDPSLESHDPNSNSRPGDKQLRGRDGWAMGDGRDDDDRPNSGCSGNDCEAKTSDYVPRKAVNWRLLLISECGIDS